MVVYMSVQHELNICETFIVPIKLHPKLSTKLHE